MFPEGHINLVSDRTFSNYQRLPEIFEGELIWYRQLLAHLAWDYNKLINKPNLYSKPFLGRSWLATVSRRKQCSLCLIIIPFLQQLQKFSRSHWLILIVNKRTDTWIYNLCDVDATNESEQFDIFYREKEIGQACSVKMAGYWHWPCLISFCVIIGPYAFFSVDAQKWSWQYPAMTSHLVNNPHIDNYLLLSYLIMWKPHFSKSNISWIFDFQIKMTGVKSVKIIAKPLSPA